MYGAPAVGLSLIFDIIRVINFAHAAFLMLSLYASFWLWHSFRIDSYPSILIVAPSFFLLGYLVQRLLIRPMFVREKALIVEPPGGSPC